ncbi:MAG TPA: FAD-dependent monooxygenase [Stellaceae bacterium]|nr:FAD-dependent monooxygenase [Stellaceae bacterium]
MATGDAAPERRVPVLIVGGGPVGLALAAELGWRGIACELIEQGDGAIATPKMNEVNTRTMEFCRRWGIAEAVESCPFPADWPMDVVFVTSLAGHELGRVERLPRRLQKPGPASPMHLEVCAQTWFDPILRRFADSFPCVRLRYGCRLESFSQDGAGVAADIVDLTTGRRERVAALFLAACDGANSAVRRSLGIGLGGPGILGHPAHLFFRAPGLLEQCGKAPGTFFVAIDRDGLWANLRIIDPAAGLWRLMVLETDGTLTPETVDRMAYLRRGLGRAIEVEWHGVSVWTRMGAVAERYQHGRVFLLGDAVHQLSPTAALGMNTGIGDAVDLGWKLAAVLEGWGGAGLLASYDAERRPVGWRNVGKSTEFHREQTAFTAGLEAIDDAGPEGEALRARLGPAVRGLGRTFRTLGLQLGYRYDDSPICVADGSTAPPDDPETYTPSARPGARAPHAFIAEGRSTLDLFGRDFVLLRLGRDAPAGAVLEAAAASRRVPLRVVTLHEPALGALYECRLVLVRPDGHVAWRGDAEPDDAVAVIDRVRGAASASPATA